MDDPGESAAPRPAPESGTSWPEPARIRWQPLRSGLLNLFRFDQVEFPFADGRLLLRGNNGSGKSRVLALQLPFLLDGETSSHRVEPDGDPAKRMDWNLLMGEHEDRLGYTWIEFGRLDESGEPHFLTLGCGLRATRGRGLHGKWFFITPLRHGRDFQLHNAHRQPHTQDKLAEILEGHGTIYRQTREYRRAVDEHLFRLGSRYEPLLELLIRLRQPKLSEKLDERILSNALSEALTPLPESLVNDIAEAFRGLEADRDELTGFESARSAVAEFLEDYRLYVQVAARRRAEHVRGSHSAFETNQRRHREAADSLAETRARTQELENQRNELETGLASAGEHLRTLRESPEMRSAEEIERARKDAEAAEKAAAEKTADTRAAGDKVDQAKSEFADSQSNADASARRAREAHERAADSAGRAALSAEHREVLPPPSDAGGDPLLPVDLGSARSHLAKAADSRKEAIRLLEARNREVEKAASSHTQAESIHSEKADALTAARAALQEAEAAFTHDGETQFADYRRWYQERTELQPTDPDTLVDDWEAWLEHLEGDSPLTRTIGEALREHTRTIEKERSSLDAESTSLHGEIAEANGTIEELRSGAQTPPEPSPTRPADRAGRAGAPFWKVFDFRENTDSRQRAGLEAALQASGLLDAWILPDGTPLDPATEDAFLSIENTPESSAAPNPHLGTLLKPCLEDLEEDSTPSRQTAETLLARIAIEPQDHGPWVSPDGTYRLGPLHGRWSKPEPEYIGETSRAAARKRRIAVLQSEIAAKQARLATLEAAMDHLRTRENTARSEAEAAPSDFAVRESGYSLTAARKQRNDAFEAEEKAREAVTETARRLQRIEKDRDREASELRLAEWIGQLADLREHLHAYENALSALWPILEGWQRDRAIAAQARRRLEEAEKEQKRQSERLQETTRAAESARRHYRTLEESCGKEAREILAKLQEAEAAEAALRKNIQTNQTQQVEAASELARVGERLQNLETERERLTRDRDEAVEAFRRFAGERLLADAHPDLSNLDADALPSVSRTVEVARRTEQRLASIASDDEAWNKRQQAIHRRIELLRDNLIPQGHSPDTRQMDDLLIVRIPFRGSDCSVSELHDALDTEIEDRKRLLDEREREVIENHLLSETATEIQRLLREAEEWVEETNKELESRPTSTGMRLRFCWEADPEGPSGLDAARRQLRQRAELWSEDQRLGLSGFFQQRIEAERVENPSASWPERLFRALDYRRWHRFSIERQQDGQWKRLTRRTHGTGSGGEKAIALTIPQFAAAAAHYRSAAPEAPRLILLDEVFVGIDSEMRAHCMALLDQFELDFMMTSEREWGCYPALPALSISHLSTRPGFNAIAVTRWRWNGQQRERT